MSRPASHFTHSKYVRWRSIFSVNSIFYTIFGVLFAIVGLQGFLVPNNFLDGGVTGISILITGFANIHISILLVVVNIPFIIMGFRKISPTFGVQTLLAVLLLAVGMYYAEIPVFTTDKVLIAVFGGFFIGIGIGLVIRGGGVIDGLDVIGQYTEKKSAFTASEIIMVLNVLMILGAAYKFGIEAAMYSILVYFTAMKTTDYVVEGFQQFTSLNIISGHSEEIKWIIANDFKKGLVVYKGERGYLPKSFNIKTDCDIIVTVVTRLEIHRISEAILHIDPKAFLFVASIKEVKGGIVNLK